jgi:NAD(P)H dehydrogenase (quinone)
VVLAHPEPSSFAAALAHTAADTLRAAGWNVVLVDLYLEGFDPVLSEADFSHRLITDRLQPMDEQAHAAAGGTFAPDLARHIELFQAAELLLLVSPMWWFSVPAMLKGWIDRVFANGVAYRYPEVPAWSGFLGGKRGMLVMTSSYEPSSFSDDSVGELTHVLHPLLHGTLAYTGMGDRSLHRLRRGFGRSGHPPAVPRRTEHPSLRPAAFRAGQGVSWYG